MKPLYVTILAAGMLLTVYPVFAEESKIEMSKLTCKQFAAYDKDNMSIIMMWLEGYYTKEDEDAAHRLRQDGRRHGASHRLLRRPS